MPASDWCATTCVKCDHSRKAIQVHRTHKRRYKASSWGWKEKDKRSEMMEQGTKFILVLSAETEQRILGFLSYQLTEEEGEDVVYCYELQLHESLRGIGIGSRLMNEMHKLGREHGYRKAMLTVFTANKAAIRFYRSLKYGMDPSSPKARRLRSCATTPDYCILSRVLSHEAT